MARSRSLLAALLIATAVAALVAAPGNAAPGPGVLVAGPVATDDPDWQVGTPKRAVHRLYAAADGREVCLSLDAPTVEGAAELEFSSEPGACGELPSEDEGDPFLVEITGGPAAAGAVRPEVATVELVGVDGSVGRLATVPAPPALAGTPAGEVRYFLGQPLAVEVRSRRLLDAAGQLLHVVEARVGTTQSTNGEVPGQFRTRTVAAGGRGEARWKVRVGLRSESQPALGNPGRRVRAVCFSVWRAPLAPSAVGEGNAAECHDPAAGATSIVAAAGCTLGQPHLVVGLATPADVPTRLIAGNGRRHPVRTITLPPEYGLGALRVVVGELGPDDALRAIVGGSAAGAVGMPPPGAADCWAEGLTGRFAGRPRSPDLGGDAVLLPAGPAGPRVFVRDHAGDRLCVAVERAVRATDCGLPGPTLRDGVFSAYRPDQTQAAGAVDARVTSVRVELSTGVRVVVPTTVEPGYAGRYAGLVRFFAVRAPAGTRILRVRPLSPRGTELTMEWMGLPRLRAPTVREAGLRIGGRPATVVSARQEDGEACLFVTPGTRLPGPGGLCPGGDRRVPAQGISLDVPCGARRPLLLTRGGAGFAWLEAQVIGRNAERPRLVRARTARLRSGDRVGVLEIPRGAGVGVVTRRGARGQALVREHFATPPATEQCGYHAHRLGA